RIRIMIRRMIKSLRSLALAQEAVFGDHIQRAQSVDRADLLPLLERAAVVADRDFEKGRAQRRDLRGDLRLDAEAILLKLDLLEQRAGKHLVAGFHVRELQPGEEVRSHREPAIDDPMPKRADLADLRMKHPRA